MISTKEKLMAAAMKLFSEQGYSSASVRKICKEAGFRESVLYNHFSGKYDILHGLFVREIDSARVQFFKSINDEDYYDPKKVLMELAKRFVLESLVDDKAKFVRIVFMEIFRDKDIKDLLIKDALISGKDLLVDLFDRMIELEVIKSKDAKFLAIEFLSPLIMLNLKFLILDSDAGYESRLEDAFKHVEFFISTIL